MDTTSWAAMAGAGPNLAALSAKADEGSSLAALYLHLKCSRLRNSPSVCPQMGRPIDEFPHFS